MAIDLETKCSKLEDEFEGEDRGEDHVEAVEEIGISFGLLVELHCKCDCVDHDEAEYCVLEHLRGDEPPNLVLYPMLGNVATNRLRLQRELDAAPLFNHEFHYCFFIGVN